MLLLLRQEWRLLRASKPYWVTLLVLGLLTALAFQIGWFRARKVGDQAERYQVEQSELRLLVKEAVRDQAANGGRLELRRGMMDDPPIDLEKLFRRPLTDIEKGRFRVYWNFAKGKNSITYIRWRTWKPPSSLAALSVGESDHWASAYTLSPSQSSKTLISPRVSNPFLQMIGALDLSTLLTVLLPLFIIVILHDFISSDQERGTLRLILSQNVSFRRVAATRLAVRVTGIMLTILAVVFAGLLLTGTNLSDTVALRLLGVFSLVVLAYVQFWASAAWLISSAGFSSVTNAVLLTMCWILLVIVVPLGWAQTLAKSHPATSLDTMAEKERELRKTARERRNRQRTEAQTADAKDGKSRPRQGMINGELNAIEQQRQAITAQIDEALKDQLSRADAMQRCETWSPAFAMKSVCDAISGNSLSQFLDYSRKTNDFQTELKSYFRWQPSSGTMLLTLDEVEKMPVFRSPSVGDNISWDRLRTTFVSLAVWSAAPLLIGWVRLRIRFP